MLFDNLSRKYEYNNDIIDYSFIQTQNKITEDGKESNNSQKGNLFLLSDNREDLGPPTRIHWKPDSEAKACAACYRPFTFINRRHHCRRCGDIFCNQCTSYTFRLDRYCKIDSKGVLSRVCRSCYNVYQKEFISSNRKLDSKCNMNNILNRSYKNYIKKININNLSPDDIKLIESDYNKIILISEYVRSNNIKGLKEMNLTIKDIKNLYNYDLLSDAIDNNANDEFIEYCMELYGHNFNYSKILANPILLALKNNNLYIAQKLIDCGANINYGDHHQDVLSYLLMTNSLNKENLQILIKNNIQINIELFEIIKKMSNTSELISSIKIFFKPDDIKNDIKIYPFDFLIFQERNNEKINCKKEILLKNILKCEYFDINTINYRSMEYIVKKKLYNLLEVLIHKKEFIESELYLHTLKYASSICDDIDILSYLIVNIDNEYMFDKYGIMLAFEIVRKQNIENKIINLIGQLIDKGININEKYNNSFLLIESIKTKNNNLTKMLIANDANVYVKDEEKKNALMLSIINENNYDIMELLLQKNIDIDDRDSNKNTVLHYACKYNAINIVKTLLNEKYKLKINEKNANGQTPLMISIIENNWSCALQLLECNNIDPNITNKEGITPLIYMTTNSIHQSEIYHKLFMHKAYFNIKYINKKSFLNKIIENDDLIYGFKDTGIFIDNGNKNIKKFNSLIFAIKINNMNLLKKLLIYDINLNEKDLKKKKKMLVALKQNNLEAIKILIENKVDYITDKQIIVHLASKCDKEIHKYIYELENINDSDDLIKNFNAENKRKNSYDSNDLIKNFNAEKKRKNSYYVSDLKKPRSRKSSNIDSSQKLNSLVNQKNNNIEFNEVSNNEYEEETLVSVTGNNENESVKNIYNNEESMELVNYKNEINIIEKISVNDINNTNQVIDDKNSSNIDEININQTTDSDNSTFINDETSNNQIINDKDIFKYPNDIFKYPELHYACLEENEVFIQMLIDYSYDINEQYDDGSTPLLLSLKNEKFRSVEILIKNKANVNIPDNEGVTPLLYAIRNFNKNEELIKKLLSFLN